MVSRMHSYMVRNGCKAAINTEIKKINIIPGVETMIWQRVKMASRKSLWT